MSLGVLVNAAKRGKTRQTGAHRHALGTPSPRKEMVTQSSAAPHAWACSKLPLRDSLRPRPAGDQVEGWPDRWDRPDHGVWPSASLRADDAHNDLRFATGASSGGCGPERPATCYIRDRLTEWLGNYSSIRTKTSAFCAYVRMRLRESCAMSSGKESVAIPATESDMAYGMINWRLWIMAPHE